MLKEEIGKRIRNIRIDMNLSKKDFAKLLEISPQYLGMIEKGNGTLSVEKLEVLCNLTNLSADYILFGKKTSFPSELQNILADYSSESIHSGFESLEKFALFMKSLSA